MELVSNDRCQQCGEEGSSFHRLYECVAHKKGQTCQETSAGSNKQSTYSRALRTHREAIQGSQQALALFDLIQISECAHFGDRNGPFGNFVAQFEDWAPKWAFFLVCACFLWSKKHECGKI